MLAQAAEVEVRPAALTLKFDVFISYSRKDLDFAKWFERALRAYLPPKDLPVPHRHLKVFRDQADLVGVELGQALEANLRNASKLVVLCSPDSRLSSYVNHEIECFGRFRGAQHIVPVLVRGTPNNEAGPENATDLAFPDALVALLTTPLAAEFRGLRPGKDKFENGAFEGAWYKTLADLYADFGVSRAQVEQREKRRKARQRALAAGLVAAVMLALLVLTIWALFERREAIRQRNDAVSRQLASVSANSNGESPDLGLLLAAAAYQSAPTLEARQSLGASFLERPRLRKLLWGHTGSLSDLAFSPDGRRVAGSGEKDKRVIVWNVADGTRLLELAAQPGAPTFSSLDDKVEKVAFTPDGRRLIAANNDGSIQVWNAETGAPLTKLGHPGSRLRTIALSPDGQRLVSALWSGELQLWNTETGAKIAASKSHTESIGSVVFSPDGHSIGSSSSDGTVALWDGEAGHAPRVLRANEKGAHAVAFTGDGKTLAAAYVTGKIRLWASDTEYVELANAQPLTAEEEMGPNLLAFSPTGNWLASGGSMLKAVTIWDLRTRRPAATLSGHEYGAHALAFSHDGRWFASVDGDGVLRQWEAEHFALVAASHGGSGCLAFSPDDRLLATCGSGRAALWDVLEPDSVASLPKHADEIGALAFSPDGKYLASTSLDRDLSLWNVREKRRQALYQPAKDQDDEYALTFPGKDLRVFAFAPDNATIATGGGRGTPRAAGGRRGDLVLWQFRDGDKTTQLDQHASRVQALAVSADGRWLASADSEAIRLRDLRSGATRVLRDTGGALSLAFDRRTTGLVAGVAQDVVLWQLASPETPAVLRGHERPVNEVLFSPDGTRVFSASFDGTVRIWDVSGERAAVVAVARHGQDINAICVSNDGRLLASASRDQTVGIWDAATGASRHLLTGHGAPVTSVAFEPKSEFLASASENGKVFLWDVATGKLSLEVRRRATVVAFSPHGKLLATAGGPQHQVSLWDVNVTEWAARACAIANRNLTCKEWRQYRGDVAYEPVCPNLPSPGSCGDEGAKPVPNAKPALPSPGPPPQPSATPLTAPASE
jgi:WD40 repeat protein